MGRCFVRDPRNTEVLKTHCNLHKTITPLNRPTPELHPPCTTPLLSPLQRSTFAPMGHGAAVPTPRPPNAFQNKIPVTKTVGYTNVSYGLMVLWIDLGPPSRADCCTICAPRRSAWCREGTWQRCTSAVGAGARRCGATADRFLRPSAASSMRSAGRGRWRLISTGRAPRPRGCGSRSIRSSRLTLRVCAASRWARRNNGPSDGCASSSRACGSRS